MTLRVLLLSRYSRLAASSRLRAFQYEPWLEQSGIKILSVPLLSDDYVRQLYLDGSTWPAGIPGGYWRRVVALLSTRRFDLLWIEKELFPWLPAIAETLLDRLGVAYVVDYDDAQFHRYDQHPSAWVRKLLGRKIDSVMRHAALVIAGNDYIATRAYEAGARWVEILPTSVDLERYAVPPETGNGVFTVGWIGNPLTANYLSLVQPALLELCQEARARLVLVGGGEAKLPGVPAENRPWLEENEVADIQGFDVGIMPLPDEPWERGKCGYKLIQYMACGKPVVASPVGVNQQIVTHGENGFLATSQVDWLKALSDLRDDPALCRRMGQAGREKVESQYSLQLSAPILLRCLHEAAGK